MEKLPNLINKDGTTIQDSQNQGRLEILTHIKTERSKRDELLKDSSSIQTKVKNFLGLKNIKKIKDSYKEIEKNLYDDVEIKHTSLNYKLKNEFDALISSSIEKPILEIHGFVDHKLNSNSLDTKDLFNNLKNAIANFSHDNLVTALSNVDRVDVKSMLVYRLRTFLSSKNINSQSENTYLIKDFVNRLGEDILKSTSNLVDKNYDFASFSGENYLFLSVLEEAKKRHQQSLSEDEEKNIYNFMLNKGLEISFYYLRKANNLVDFASQYNDEFNQKLKLKIEGLFVSKQWGEVGAACTADSVMSKFALESLESYLLKYNLNAKDFYKSWEIRRGKRDDVEFNLKKIEDLEAERPGITSVLFKDFGIKEFRRYSSDILINQFDQKDLELPYGLVFFSNSDHNDTFDQKSHVINPMYEELKKNNFALRITEFEDKIDIFKRLIFLNQKYGDKNKISFMLLGAHGSTGSFSVWDFYKSVSKNDFVGKGVQKIKDFFVDNPEIIMASCSTGVEYGIGQKISEVYGATVHAPTQDTSIKKINVSFVENKPTFEVYYNYGLGKSYNKGV